jgi:DNA-binding SARP family transcriptional activator
VEFRVLGPLEVVDADRRVELGGPRQRGLLAYLLMHSNEAVAAERLVEELWGSSAPGANAVQVTVSRLRKVLGSDRLLTRTPGYLLRVAPGECDRDVFQQLLDEARRELSQSRPAEAAKMLRRALGLWRGEPFADFRYEPFAQAEIARLEELRLSCLEDRVEADLALSRHAELVSELEALTREHPLRQRPRAQLMLALYRCGRHADALAVYQATREHLLEELGIEPGSELRELHQAILRQDTELELPAAPSAAEAAEASGSEPKPSSPPPPPAVRKTVTVLVTGTGEPAGGAPLDPELRRRTADRAFVEIAPVLERHGASVERLQDGRLMGVFGVPAAHEDDALRAVRAGVELRDAFAGTAGAVRIGIDSGEVLAGGGNSSDPLVTGSPVDAAVSLQQVGDAGEIVVGAATRRFVRDAVRCEPVDVGAGRPSAWRLLELVPDAPPYERHFEAPLVGRDGELAQLHQAFERARRERRAQLFTVFGEAGIGKTRLALELAQSIDDQASVLTGRCLSYGEGITYWPVREMVTQACGGRELRELLGEDPDAGAIVERLDTAVGTGTSGAVGEEVFWAFRKLAEVMAQELPLVLVFEDVHWGEPTLLDLIEHLADWVRSATVLILCLARPELLDGRPGWAGGKLNATSILLEPLSEDESSLLIGALAAGSELSPDASHHIATAAEGNPLFLEQMLAMLAESGDTSGELAVPPAIQALLAARLDHLTPDERHVIGRASVEGELFHVSGVVELASPEAQDAVTSHLTSLVRKELIRPELPTLPGQEAFGFRHALIRDAAYASLPKQARSDLHERYAAWLERALGDRAVEGEEFLAYHLEQAHHYRVELGIEDESTEALAARSGTLLASAGARAFSRGDWPATVNLYERALALLSPESPLGRHLMPDLSLALFQAGNADRADAVAAEAMATAQDAEDAPTWSRAAVTHTYFDFYLRADRVDPKAARREAEQAFRVFDELDDDRGRARAIFNLDLAEWASGSADGLGRSAERAIFYARRAGIRPDELECCAGFSWSMCFGTTRAGVGQQRIEEVVLGAGHDRSLEALASVFIALLDGMEGRLGDARQRMERGRQALAEVGLHHWVRWSGLLDASLALIAEDLAVAERVSRETISVASGSAEDLLRRAAEIQLTRAVHGQGRHDEALALAEALEDAATPVDLHWRTNRLGARALALASRDHLHRAEALGREAVDLGRRTDNLNLRGDTLVGLAEILGRAGRPVEAVSPLIEAVTLYERKGNVVSAARARSLLDELP